MSNQSYCHNVGLGVDRRNKIYCIYTKYIDKHEVSHQGAYGGSPKSYSYSYDCFPTKL